MTSRDLIANPCSVLFLCGHNAGRSQMAAGWLRSMGGESVRVLSAGSNPATELNPVAVAAMSEVGIDITGNVPKRWTPEMVKPMDVVISMGCGDTCPTVSGQRYEDWELDDPAGQEIAEVRVVRDQIQQLVKSLLTSLAG